MGVIDYSGGVVSAPVSLKGVADLLNSSGSGALAKYSVGRVCTSVRVNKWSKRKPVRDGALFGTDTDTFFSQMSKGRIWGMEVCERSNGLPDAQSMYQWCEQWDDGNWVYIRPNGGAESPYRLGDFKGYCHLASPMCRSVDMAKDGVRAVKLGVTELNTGKIRFYVEGIHSTLGGVGFSDIGDGGDSQLVLCANVYKGDETTCREVINNNKLIGELGQGTSLDRLADDGCEFDDGADRWKFVDVGFEVPLDSELKTVFWVYLTLDYVKLVSGAWVSMRKLVIPWSDECHYLQKVEVERLLNSLQIQARMVQYGYDANTIGAAAEDRLLWQSVQEGIGIYDGYFRSPRIKFEVSQIKDDITFGGAGGYRLVCKVGGRSVTGKLISAAGNDLTSVTLSGGGGMSYKTDYVYVEFDELFPGGENAYVRGTRYGVDLWLVNDSEGKVINKMIGNFSLMLSRG